MNTSFDTSIDITLGPMFLPLEDELLLWSDLCHQLARKVERGENGLMKYLACTSALANLGDWPLKEIEKRIAKVNDEFFLKLIMP